MSILPIDSPYLIPSLLISPLLIIVFSLFIPHFFWAFDDLTLFSLLNSSDRHGSVFPFLHILYPRSLPHSITLYSFLFISLYHYYTLKNLFNLYISLFPSNILHLTHMHIITELVHFRTDTGRPVGPYENFNMILYKHTHSHVIAEFPGYGSRFNEQYPVISTLLAPYRTRTSRPVR